MTEELARGPMKYSHITASAQIKASAGYLARIIVNASNTATTLTIYDNTAGSGTVIHQAGYQATIASQVDVWSIEIGCDFSTGCYVSLSGGTPKVCVIYQ